MKKILFLIPGLSEGGAEKVLCNLVNNMDQTKYDITVQNIDPYDYRSYLAKGIHYKAINNCRTRVGRKLFALFFRLCAELKLAYPLFIRGDYDLEIAYLETIATKLLAQSTNKKATKLAWVHCDLSLKDNMKNSVDKVRKQYQRYDRIVCVSEDVKKGFCRLYGDNFHTEVFHNIIDDTEILKKAAEPMPACLDVSVPKLLAVGRLTAQKNFSYLIRSCGMLRDAGFSFNLNILGEGPEQEKLQNLIHELNLEEYVSLQGFQSNPYPWIANSDLMVCSSRYEGISTFVQEAFVLGKPIVTTPCTGMSELLGDSEYGLVVEDDENGLFNGICSMLKTPALMSKYRVASAERYKVFSKKTLIRETESLFDNLINNRKQLE
ncbi:MAG: glycosyltransferase [Lachnospiraceae bacterium]|nr:glycosyltransferase [Lachnospiraceae bacterium]